MRDFLFTSESVSEGHPDKVCDKISDAVLDLYLSQDRNARVAVETLATTKAVILAGEVSTVANITNTDVDRRVRAVIDDIGYHQENFNSSITILNLIHTQSPDIAMGVDIGGAGDQGIMFGYAKKEGGFETNYMPMAIYLANKILENLRQARKTGKIEGLEPDAKSQVTVIYKNNLPVGISKIVVSSQHSKDLTQQDVRKLILPIIEETLPEGWMPKDEDILINPTGKFVIGGPDGDTGLTGRKIIVDNYGGYAPHGGGNFHGKDPTKVDRSAAYMARYLAKNIVAADLASECTIQLSYAIGVAQPLSIFIDCHETNTVAEELILHKISRLDLTPQGIINTLGLRNPIYYPTAAYGHFGKEYKNDGFFTWENLNLVEYFKH